MSLTPELEGIVQAYVQKGMYGNQSEVIRAALRLLHEADQERELRLEALRRDVGLGLEQVVSGTVQSLTAEEIKARGRQRLSQSE